MTKATLTVIYHLSDQAYNNLIKLGKQYYYIPPDNKIIPRGLTALCRALAAIPIEQWQDTRPASVSHQDRQYLEANLFLPWYRYSPARPHTINLGWETITLFLDIANHFGIDARQHRTPRGVAAAVIEAIGTMWLTPTYIPPGKWATKRHRVKPEMTQISF
jgi:hypothetical protein